jgi:hypothetical protein
VEYYGCHKKGYYKNEYRASRKTQNQVLEIKKIVDHDSFYWSACYKDYYRTHKNGKENTEYYPEQNRQVYIIIYNEGDPDDYDIKPSYLNNQEEEGPWPENKNNYKNNYKHDV